MAVSGDLTPAQVGDSIAFRDENGSTILTYGDLQVTDANSQALPAHLEINRSLRTNDRSPFTIRILVEDANAAYSLTINPWVETAKLIASDGAYEDYFGLSVAISGDVIVVGAGDAAYVFVKPGDGWITGTETPKLTASEGVESDLFGGSVAISGDTIVVGVPWGNTAYVFAKPGSGWVSGTETAKLTASDGVEGYAFGLSVAILSWSELKKEARDRPMYLKKRLTKFTCL